MAYKISVEEAFRDFGDMVYRLAFSRTKNTADAEDILQDVFLRFMKTKTEIESLEHAKALLIRITINCSKSLFSSAWRKNFAELSENLEAPQASRDTLYAVLSLPLKYRTVIHLHYYCGYQVEEIADLLSIKVSTVKSQLHRAREKLKCELEGVEF